jgi:hypothetical protein
MAFTILTNSRNVGRPTRSSDLVIRVGLRQKHIYFSVPYAIVEKAGMGTVTRVSICIGSGEDQGVVGLVPGTSNIDSRQWLPHNVDPRNRRIRTINLIASNLGYAGQQTWHEEVVPIFTPGEQSIKFRLPGKGAA